MLRHWKFFLFEFKIIIWAKAKKAINFQIFRIWKKKKLIFGFDLDSTFIELQLRNKLDKLNV